jgi:hypothetical protein
MTLDQIVTQYLPTDFTGIIQQFLGAFPIGVLLGVAAWVLSITVYACFKILKSV